MAEALGRLNPEQRMAVETIDGPLLVLAGAGTGKTRVLTTRFAYLIASGAARAEEILAFTFTNKAAREMRERVAALLGGPVETLWIGTFHAIAARLLRRHAEAVGLRPDFTILDTDDQLRLIRTLPPSRASTRNRPRPASCLPRSSAGRIAPSPPRRFRRRRRPVWRTARGSTSTPPTRSGCAA
jgi:DNA helicase-2/ATP-dependent DNA helicase PcrA